MRRVLVAAALAVAFLACSRDHGTVEDAAPSASSSSTPSSSAPEGVPSQVPTTAPTLVGSGAPPSTGVPPPPAGSGHAVGTGCSPGRDSIACTPDGLEVLTCASGQWRMLQACH